MKSESLFKFLEATDSDPYHTQSDRLPIYCQTPCRVETFNRSGQYIFPFMHFNKTGIITKWIFAAKFDRLHSPNTDNTIRFQIWRNENETRQMIHETNAMPRPTGYLNVFEAYVPMSDRITIMPGDVNEFGLVIPEGGSPYSLAYVQSINDIDCSSIDHQIFNSPRLGTTSVHDCWVLPLVIAEMGALS